MPVRDPTGLRGHFLSGSQKIIDKVGIYLHQKSKKKTEYGGYDLKPSVCCCQAHPSMTGTAAPANVLGRAANSHAFIEFVLTVSIHFILKMCKDKQLILYLYSSFKRKRHEETCSLFVACRSAVYFLCHCFSVEVSRSGTHQAV